MKKQGINLENVKASNREAILRLLNNQGPMSRKDIAKAIGLTPASVTLICAELIEAGIILELGEMEESKRAGRKKILVAINNTYKYVLCASIEADETYISVTDLQGNIVSNLVVLTDASIPAKDFLLSVSAEIKTMMWEAGLSKDQILGMGVSVPGQVDAESGVSINSYNIWTEPVEIKAVFEEALGVDVVVENNLKTFAKSEIIFGAGRENDNLFILKWGPGVGSAIITDHKIYQGATGMAAEVGHMVNPAGGALCKCGRRGCLETEVSTHAIINSIMEAYGSSKESQKQMPVFHSWLNAGNEISYKNASEWGALEDEKLQSIIAEKIKRLAYTTINIVQILDPNRIVLVGYLFGVPTFLSRFKAEYLAIDSVHDDSFFIEANSRQQLHIEALAIVLDKMYF